MAYFDLTILVIDENAIRASIIEEGLREAGHARVTVVHEVAHHFGIDDERLHELGWA